MANLVVQAAPICVLAMGLVFVLLLGEIDLSAGVAGGVCAAVMAADARRPRLAVVVAILAALVVGAVIGLCIGCLVALLGIPSFVVTLAFFLGLQGVTLKLIGAGRHRPGPRRGARGLTIKQRAGRRPAGSSRRGRRRAYAAAPAVAATARARPRDLATGRSAW